MRDELLNGEIFYTLAEAKILIEAWRRHYNTVRPHSSLGYRPPAPETTTPPWPPSGSASLHLCARSRLPLSGFGGEYTGSGRTPGTTAGRSFRRCEVCIESDGPTRQLTHQTAILIESKSRSTSLSCRDFHAIDRKRPPRKCVMKIFPARARATSFRFRDTSARCCAGRSRSHAAAHNQARRGPWSRRWHSGGRGPCGPRRRS